MLRYFLIWPGAPVMGSPENADVILVQAFGRNHFPDNELFKVRNLRDAISQSNPDLIKVLRRRVDIGIPNKELADVTRNLVEKYKIPAIVQWEIALGFTHEWLKKWEEYIIILWPPGKPGKYFSTYDVKKLSFEEMEERGLKNPIEISHKRQIVRSALITKKLLGKMPIIISEQPSSFDSRSVQLWTRNSFLWFLREFLGRIHHIIFKLV